MSEVDLLVARSNELGSDKRVTNFGGGNTSCKAVETDPVTGAQVEVLWVKGSGGDLGTLTKSGLASVSLPAMYALRDRYRGEAFEDEMVELQWHAVFNRNPVAPSIDTPLHAFLPAKHVDHLHPDAVIALAACADGERLTKEVYGDEIVWLEWRRPGWELGLRCERAARDSPNARGIMLGGHGLMTWGETSEECKRTTLEVIAKAEAFLAGREALGEVIAPPLGPDERRAKAAELGPRIRGACSSSRRVVGHFRDDDVVLDFLSRADARRLASLGTSCPDHFLRTKVEPLWLDGDLDELVAAYRERYAAYYDRHKVAGSPPMRGSDPAIVLVPRVGMFSFGPDADAARIAGEFYVNAINVIRGAESVSTYTPISEREKFRIEYWALEEAKLRRLPKPKPLTGKVALVVGGASGIGKACAQRLAGEGATVVVADREPGGLLVDVTREDAVRGAVDEVVLRHGGLDIVVQSAGLSISKPLEDTTTGDWDLQFDVMARGSFLVAREAARVMTAQATGGDIVLIVSKNAVVAGPHNAAYGAAKAAQAHLVRLLAADLGARGIRVNGVNPDAVVQGSGIFAGGWGADRAKVHGVKEEDLGKFYAQRTLLNEEVLPDDIAAAVFALVGGELGKTTGTIIPVDGGVPAAFQR